VQTNQIVLISPEDLQKMIESAVTNALQKMKEEKSELLTFKQACALLQISPSTLFKWKAENRVPFKRLGKRILFNRKEIIAVLEDVGFYNKQKKLAVLTE